MQSYQPPIFPALQDDPKIAYAICSAYAFLNTDALRSAHALSNAEALRITHAGPRASASLVAYVLEIAGIYRILLLV
jgi:hypothetical protein